MIQRTKDKGQRTMDKGHRTNPRPPFQDLTSGWIEPESDNHRSIDKNKRISMKNLLVSEKLVPPSENVEDEENWDRLFFNLSTRLSCGFITFSLPSSNIASWKTSFSFKLSVLLCSFELIFVELAILLSQNQGLELWSKEKTVTGNKKKLTMNN